MTDDRRDEPERQFRWEMPPAWLLILALFAFVAVGAAYWASPFPSPLDAVNTADSLLLTLLLVYLYGKQTQILHNQQQIQREQFQAQRAATLNPRLRIGNWSLTEDSLEAEVKNVGDGRAHDLRLVTELSVPYPSRRQDFELEPWQTPLIPTDLLAQAESQDWKDIETDIKFKLRDTSIGSEGIEEVSFQEVSRRISKAHGAKGRDTNINISFTIECDNALGETGDSEAIIADKEVTISGPSVITGSDERGVTVTTCEPELIILENDFFVASGEEDLDYRFDVEGYDCTTIELENVGTATAFNIEAGLRIKIKDEDEWILVSNYLDDHEEYDILIAEWGSKADGNGAHLQPDTIDSFTAPLRFYLGSANLGSFEEVVEKLIEADIDNELLLELVVAFDDGAAHESRTENILLEIPERPTDYLPNPMSFTELWDQYEQ